MELPIEVSERFLQKTHELLLKFRDEHRGEPDTEWDDTDYAIEDHIQDVETLLGYNWDK